MVMSFTTVLISVLIIPKVKELKVHIFVTVYLLLIIWWPILYCVYLFYKDLINNKTDSVPAENGENTIEIQGTSQTTSG